MTKKYIYFGKYKIKDIRSSLIKNGFSDSFKDNDYSLSNFLYYYNYIIIYVIGNTYFCLGVDIKKKKYCWLAHRLALGTKEINEVIKI